MKGPKLSTVPTIRQIEALLLRYEGKKHSEAAKVLGVTKATASQLARAAAIKLIRYTPIPSMVGLAEKARAAYPKIASR